MGKAWSLSISCDLQQSYLPNLPMSIRFSSVPTYVLPLDLRIAQPRMQTTNSVALLSRSLLDLEVNRMQAAITMAVSLHNVVIGIELHYLSPSPDGRQRALRITQPPLHARLPRHLFRCLSHRSRRRPPSPGPARGPIHPVLVPSRRGRLMCRWSRVEENRLAKA